MCWRSMVSHGNSMQHSTRSSMCFVFSRQPAALPALRHGGKRFRNAASRWEKKPRLDLQGFAMQVKAYGDLWGSWTINAISFRMAKTWSTRQGKSRWATRNAKSEICVDFCEGRACGCLAQPCPPPFGFQVIYIYICSIQRLDERYNIGTTITFAKACAMFRNTGSWGNLFRNCWVQAFAPHAYCVPFSQNHNQQNLSPDSRICLKTWESEICSKSGGGGVDNSMSRLRDMRSLW